MGVPQLILDLRTARADDPASEWLRAPRKLRSIGAMAMDQQFQPAPTSTMFDALVFLRPNDAIARLWNQQ